MNTDKSFNSNHLYFSHHQQFRLDKYLSSSSPKYELLCGQLNNLYQFCFNQKCKCSFNFICEIPKCQSCNPIHIQCQRGSIEFILKSLKNKISATDKIKNQIENQINQLIKELEEMKIKVNKNIDEKLRYVMVKDIQLEFIKVLHKEISSNKFNGQRLNVLRQIYTNTNNNNKQQQNLPPNINTIIKQLTQFTQKQIQQTRHITTKLCLMIDNISQYKIPSFDNFLQLSIKKKSSILNKQEDVRKFIEMFTNNNNNKKVKQFKLMYKASENSFRMKEYYNKCGNVADSVVVCLTDKGKIIGGYTPLAFDCVKSVNYNNSNNTINNKQQQQDCYIPDPSLSSFLFSITDNKKSHLRIPSQAIYRHSSKQYIQFGYGGQLAICDQANVNKQCFTDFINTSYFNQYYENNKNGFIKFNGNETNCFGLMEWEVWRVKYDEE